MRKSKAMFEQHEKFGMKHELSSWCVDIYARISINVDANAWRCFDVSKNMSTMYANFEAWRKLKCAELVEKCYFANEENKVSMASRFKLN